MFSPAPQGQHSDHFSASAIRGDMMKLQQFIHQVNVKYEQVMKAIPPNLSETMVSLSKQANSLKSQVDTETSYDYLKSIAALDSKIQGLQIALNEHIEETRNNPKDHNIDEILANIEHKITFQNLEFMDQLQQKIEKRIKENTDKIANESSRPVDLHLSANFSSNDEKSQIIQIETTSPLDPDIHFRVQRHTNRIHLVENDIEDVLSTNLPTYMPQKVIRQLNEQAQNNQNLIDELQKKFEDFESDLRDIKSEKLEKEEQKKKLKDNSIVPGAITHAEFTTYQEHIFNKFSEISHNISLSVLDTEKSLVDLNDQLQLIEGKINNYNESALGFGALIKMTSKQVFNAEQKLKEKSRFQLTTTQNSGMKLKQIEEQGKIKVDEMSFKVKEEINSLKKKIARISADLKNEMKEPPVNPPND